MSRLLKQLSRAGFIAGTLSLSSFSGAIYGQSAEMDHSKHAEMMEKTVCTPVKTADVRLTDALLTDQSGAESKLKSEILGDHIVVVDFIFTTCTTICPVTTALLAASRRDYENLQDVKYISISIDPNNDTPARLASFAEKQKADWTFLTGDKSVVDKVLTDVDAYSTNPEDHAPMILVGDASTGEFVRLFGLPQADQIDEHVTYFKSKRMTAEHGEHQHAH